MTVHPHIELIETFYSAFERGDAETMAACYHPEVRFEDPAFGELRGEEAGDMWRMLLERSSDLEITWEDVEAGDERGKAHWEARYAFGPNRRPVHNMIEASFHFRDGKIVRHVDRFPFNRWARQALGTVGALLGWTPWLKGRVRQQTRGLLSAYREKKAEATGPPFAGNQ